MLEAGYADCDSYSNAIMCLSELYNVTCRFYQEIRFDNSGETFRERAIETNPKNMRCN